MAEEEREQAASGVRKRRRIRVPIPKPCNRSWPKSSGWGPWTGGPKQLLADLRKWDPSSLAVVVATGPGRHAYRRQVLTSGPKPEAADSPLRATVAAGGELRGLAGRGRAAPRQLKRPGRCRVVAQIAGSEDRRPRRRAKTCRRGDEPRWSRRRTAPRPQSIGNAFRRGDSPIGSPAERDGRQRRRSRPRGLSANALPAGRAADDAMAPIPGATPASTGVLVEGTVRAADVA